MSEVTRKLQLVRQVMAKEKLGALRLRGVDWFSWATGGHTSAVLLSSQRGVAEIFITERDAFALTTRIEDPRLRNEELPSELTLQVFPWQASWENFVKSKIANGRVASDFPQDEEASLSLSIKQLKWKLQPEEISRYKVIGQAAAVAASKSLSLVNPKSTERELAAITAKELVLCGLDPDLILVGGQQRSRLYRHPIPKNVPIGDQVMLVICARGFGLYANLTRVVYFRPLTMDENKDWEKLARIECAALNSTRIGAKLSDVYQRLAMAYAAEKCPEQIDQHHQGGSTGYLAREIVAGPDTAQPIDCDNAFAWNPSLPGMKREDTFLLEAAGLRCLTSVMADERDAAFVMV